MVKVAAVVLAFSMNGLAAGEELRPPMVTLLPAKRNPVSAEVDASPKVTALLAVRAVLLPICRIPPPKVADPMVTPPVNELLPLRMSVVIYDEGVIFTPPLPGTVTPLRIKLR